MSIFFTNDAYESAKERDMLQSGDEDLVIEALHTLHAKKLEAFKVVSAELNTPTRQFTQRDFGIPQIERLLEKLGEEV